MRQDPYTKRMFKKWLIPKVISAGICFIIILVIFVIVSMNDRTIRLNEGVTKSMPLLSNEKMKMLGDLYVRLNSNFENEIKNLELTYANRLNKRGDRIHYGVNGKENVDAMINDDYVNGIESISYVKGNASDRYDGESNFADMMAFLSASLGSDIDRYTEEQLKNVFTSLFNLTHTFTGSSTELYPCDHGCAWCKYYCGDSRCQGELNGNTVGFYQCDYYMGEEGKYGLMYDPFLINKRSNYSEIEFLADDETFMKTTAIVGPPCHTSYNSDNFSGDSNTYAGTGRVSVNDTSSDIFSFEEAEGICPVCSAGKATFTSTTKKFSGCVAVSMELSELNRHRIESAKVYNSDYDSGLCFHGDCVVLEDDAHNNEKPIWHAVGASPTKCNSCEPEYYCGHIHKSSCENDDGEMTCGHDEEDGALGCMGEYNCNGHVHYACPGHIIICCFGHTNLNLEIKIMYYEEMIDKLKSIITE